MNLGFDVTELHRRLANLILIGRIVEVDYNAARPLAKVKIGELASAWLPIMSPRAHHDTSLWPLEKDEQVVLLCPSGDTAQGVIIGALHQQRFPVPERSLGVHRTVYADGAVLEYDRVQHHLHARLPEGATTQLMSSGGIEIQGDVVVRGNITATQDITDQVRSMNADRSIYNTHTHSGVMSGPGTSAPTAQTL